MLESIGNRIKKAINDSELTQSYIADQCGVSKQAVTGWITTNSIDKNNLMKVSKLTGADFSWLLEGNKKGKMFNTESTQGVNEERVRYSKEDIDRLNRISKLSPADQARLDSIINAFDNHMDNKTGS